MEFTPRSDCAQCEHATTLTSYCVDLEDIWFSIQLERNMPLIWPDLTS